MRFALLIGIVGCASSGSRPAAAHLTDGVYEYSANIPGSQPGRTLWVRGSFTIVGDSLFIQSDTNCTATRPATQLDPAIGRIYCGAAILSIDRRNPTASRWNGSVQVPKQRMVCVEYEPRPPSGNRPRCLRQKPEAYYENQLRSGVVQIKRID